MKLCRSLFYLFSTVAVIASVGCGGGGAARTTSPVASQGEKRYFFPPEPALPRVQYLTSLKFADDWGAGRGRKTKEGSFADWVAGEEKPTAAPTRIDTPYGVDAHNGKVYICDTGRNCVHIIDAARGSHDLLRSSGAFKNPVDIAIDHRTGNKYVTDTGAGLVHIFNASDSFVSSFGDPSTFNPIDVIVSGDEVFVTDRAAGKIRVFTKQGEHVRDMSSKGMGPDQLDMATNIAAGPNGLLYVSDIMAQQVKIFDKQGQFRGTIGRPGDAAGSFARPKGVAVDPHGHIYVVDAQWGVVQVFADDTRLMLIISGKDGAPGVVLPAGIAIDATSLPAFRKYIAPDFEAEYLIFLINQHGTRKLSVYAYGRSTKVPAEVYEMPPKAPASQ